MSRIGKQTIGIPDGVTVNIANGEIQVKGPKGNLTGAIPEGIDAKVEDGVLSFARPDDSKPARMLDEIRAAGETQSEACELFNANLGEYEVL